MVGNYPMREQKERFPADIAVALRNSLEDPECTFVDCIM